MSAPDPARQAADEELAHAQEIQKRIEAGDASVLPLLLRRIKTSKDKVLRRLLARAASSIAQADQLRFMAKLYLDQDYQLRLWALAAITRLEDHRYYPLVVRAFVFDENHRVRSACRRALKRLSPDQRHRLLQQMSQTEKEWMREASKLAEGLLSDLDQDSIHAGSASMDLDLAALGSADLGPRGDYPEEPSEDEEPPPDPDASQVVDERYLDEEWRRQHEEKRRKMGIAEAIARDGQDGDQRTFTRRDCPECGERIMVEAVVCRYCNLVFDQEGLDEVLELAKVKVVPLPIRSPSHRGSALVADLIVAALLAPIGGIGVLYFLLKDGVREGQSLGKRLYNMKVVDVSDGSPCTPKQSLQRNLMLFVPFIPMLEVVLLAATGTRTGDAAAGTRVVFTDDPPASALLASSVLAMMALLALTLVVVFMHREGFLG